MIHRILSPVVTLSLLAALLLSPGLCPAGDAPLTIGIIGDSTVCEFRPDLPQRGWGQMLSGYFVPGTVFVNQAKAGASSKTFPNDRWLKVLNARPAFILIEFGFNDQHAKTQPESTDASTDFKDNLRNFIREAREAGATPILVTPNHRRTYDSQAALTRELDPYVAAMKEIAREMDVPLVDLHASSGVLYESLGETGSDAFTINNTDHADRPGRGDRTHFTEHGAREMARLVAMGLVPLDPRLKAAIQLPPAAN